VGLHVAHQQPQPASLAVEWLILCGKAPHSKIHSTPIVYIDIHMDSFQSTVPVGEVFFGQKVVDSSPKCHGLSSSSLSNFEVALDVGAEMDTGSTKMSGWTATACDERYCCMHVCV